MTRLLKGLTKLAAAALACVSVNASALTLPTCIPNVTCLVFGDFDVYSLALLNGIFKPGDFDPQQGNDPFRVQSGPGQITGDVVIGTGPTGMNLNQNFANMDDAYRTPEAGGGSSFSTQTVTDPPTLGTLEPFATPGDQTTTWDASTAALRTFLATGGGQLAAFFNLNETGTEGLLGIDLLIWIHVSLTGSSPTKDFWLTSTVNPTAATEGAGPDPTAAVPEADSRWVYVHGTICVNGTTFLHLGPCVAGDPPGSQNVNQNLGANTAAFAIFNQELNDLVLDPTSGYDFLHIDWRMARINNGYEQAFILADTTVVPEPGTLWLWGALLVAFGAFNRRRR